MKKVVLTVVIIVGIIGLGAAALELFKMNTKKYSPEAIAKYKKDGLNLRIEYCQPSKKGRPIFGTNLNSADKSQPNYLVPYNEVWRTGANEATLFVTNKSLKLGNETLEAGKYSLFTIPNKDKWTVIINGETGQWGTQYDESEDVLRVNASLEQVEDEKEVFTIKFDDVDGQLKLLLMWDNVKAQLPIEVEG